VVGVVVLGEGVLHNEPFVHGGRRSFGTLGLRSISLDFD
jgi:hypothetical protein